MPAAIVSCVGEHDNEVAGMVAITPAADDAYPGGEAVAEEVEEACAPEYEAFLGRDIGDTVLTAFIIWPDEDDWDNGARNGVCALYYDEPLVGTAASGSLTAPGTMLALLAESDGVLDVWVADGETGELTMNLSAGAFDSILSSQPSWSPDASAAAFAAIGPGGDSDLYLASTEGLGILPVLEGPGEDDRPVIAPVGTKFAFISDRQSEEFDIYTIDFGNDGAIERLTDHPDRDSSPAWSPDGTEIAFRRRTDGNSDIWVMNADGSDARQLTDDPAFDGDPMWSPDGQLIAFTTDREGDFDIWVMNADGSDQLPLTDHPADEEYPTWSPDGSLIAFMSNRHGGTQVWIVRADGSDASLLVAYAPSGYPMFAPAG